MSWQSDVPEWRTKFADDDDVVTEPLNFAKHAETACAIIAVFMLPPSEK